MGVSQKKLEELGKYWIIYKIITRLLSLPTLGEINYVILELVMEKTILLPYSFLDPVLSLTALFAG